MTVVHEPTMEMTLEGKLIQVEPISQRIKVYQLPYQRMETTLKAIKSLAIRKKCDKLIFYVTDEERRRVQHPDLLFEGVIRGFFRGEDAYIYSLFLNPKRKRSSVRTQEKQAMKWGRPQSGTSRGTVLSESYVMRFPGEQDSYLMSELYRTVFRSYPTPMHDPRYVSRLLQKPNVHFTIVEHRGEVVSACSADILPSFQCAEMSDCATLPQHRGKGLLSYQFSYLINKMRKQGIYTLFSYSRVKSAAMNLINVKHEFTYGGCMIRNSNISGGLEDMNIWYKKLSV